MPGWTLERRADLATALAPFPAWPRFLAQLGAVRTLVHRGNPAGKKDPTGPEPPLNMPRWEERLTGDQIDAVLTYLLSEYPWEEVEL